MNKDVAEMMAEKGSLEKEFIELMLIADEPIITADVLKHFMFSSIAHSLAVIADTLSNRAEQTEPQIDCHKCADFWNCDGQCDEVEDEPQTERRE